MPASHADERTSDSRAPFRHTILVVVPKLTVGGTERHLLEVLPRLDHRQFSIRAFATRGPGTLDEAMRARGIEVITAPPILGGRLNAGPAAARLVALMARLRPDLVHFFLPEAYLIGAICGLLTRRPRMVMSRRNLNLYQRGRPLSSRIERHLHKRMTAIIGNSRAVIEQLSHEDAPAARLGLIRNGVDLDRYSGGDRRQARSVLALPQDALVLTMVATLFAYKGHADLIAALGRIDCRLPKEWVLLLVGRDQDRIEPELRANSEQAGIAQHVRWLGERENVSEVLLASDVGVLCSHQEGLPNSVLEGMAAGLPMIATEVGGVPDAVRHGETGLIVPPHDPASLGRAILELAHDPDRRRAMGAAGRTRVAASFSLAGCVAQYQRLYRSLLDDDPRPIAEVLADATGPGRTAD